MAQSHQLNDLHSSNKNLAKEIRSIKNSIDIVSEEKKELTDKISELTKLNNNFENEIKKKSSSLNVVINNELGKTKSGFFKKIPREKKLYRKHLKCLSKKIN
jgi:peptidoglycan hydrolase CwlO-like protein